MLEATLLFLIKNNRILLAMKKRGFGVNRFNGVGGKKEPGENIEQTMVRETKEEINVTPTKYNKFAEIIFDEFYKGQPTIIKMHVFIASEWLGSPAESDEMKPQWFDIDKIPLDKMWPDDKFWLKLVLDNKKVKAKFKLDKNDKIVNHDLKIIEAF